MKSTHCDQDVKTTDQCSSTSTSSQSCPDEINIFGDPLVSPRIGNNFQADIPYMKSEVGCVLPLVRSAKSQVPNVSASFPMGLPIPVSRIHELHCLESRGSGSLDNPSGSTSTMDLNGSVKCCNYKKKEMEKGSIISHQSVNLENMKSPKIDHQVTFETNFNHQYLYGDCPLCRSAKPWTEHEADVLLLGLFVFGKDFVQVKKLLENKDLGDILSFYYGRFYRSDKYNRWADCRKMISKKCVLGDRIFTGWRLQELLNRLLPHVSSKVKEEFLQVSDSFAEGTTSMEEYVLYIQNKVGTHALVEAIGIGKGKEDLTDSAMNNVKHSHVYPETPTIKDFSAFTSKEIVMFLTGGLKLTKARSKDLFWEAIWPRLLVKGWRIKKSQNLAPAASRNHSTFLAPGTTKLSIKKRVKGKHYFESISDILDKVVSEPKLLELEHEATKTYERKEISLCMPNQTTYTIVDTSSTLGGKSSNFRQLRCLPVKLTTRSNLTDRSRKYENKNCKDLPDEFELKAAKARLGDERNAGAHSNNEIRGIDGAKPTVLHTDRLNETKNLVNQIVDDASGEDLFTKETVRDASYCLQDEHELCAADVFAGDQEKKSFSNHGSLQNMKDCSGTEIKIGKKSEDWTTNTSDDKLSKGIIKYQFSRRPKTGNLNHVAPVFKQNTSSSDGESLKRQIKYHFSRRPKTGHLNHAAPLVKERIIDILDDKPLKSAIVYQFSRRRKSGHSNLVASPLKQSTMADEKPVKQAIKYQFSRRPKRGRSDHVAPLVKRRRLTACAKEETSHMDRNFFGDPLSEDLVPCCRLTTTDAGEKESTDVVDEEDIPSISAHEEVSARVASTSKFRNLRDLDLDMSCRENEKSLTIELKGAEMKMTFDNGHSSKDEDGHDQDRNGNDLLFPQEINHHNPLGFRPDTDAQENKLNMNLRRQSKRNRQLTLRALEAFATGVLKI